MRVPVIVSIFPWWGWLIGGVLAGISFKAASLIANDARLDSPTPLRWHVASLTASVALWVSVLACAIAIASLDNFWSTAAMAALLLITAYGMIDSGDEQRRSEERITRKIDSMTDKMLDELRQIRERAESR